MAFQLKANEHTGAGVYRILAELVDDALNDLTEAPEGVDKGVHNARKRMKRVRAVLRLVRDTIGKKAYRRENVAYRDIARTLSGARDSRVLRDTFDKLLTTTDSTPDIEALTAIRGELEAEYEALAAQPTRFDDTIAGLEKARQRLDKLRLSGDDFNVMRGGLARVYERGKEAFAAAGKSPTDENLHDWRKYAKYLWHHVEILSPAWENVLPACAEELHTLADYLGDDHDYAVLKARLLQHDDGDTVYWLTRHINSERERLQRAAMHLGARLYADNTPAFVERHATYWEAWQHETA